MKSFVEQNSIFFKVENKHYKSALIYQIDEEKEDDSRDIYNNNFIAYKMSDILKTIILLYISQKNYENKEIPHNIEKVYFLNNEWLEKKECNIIKKEIDKVWSQYLYKHKNPLEEIIHKLDFKILEEIDNKISKKSSIIFYNANHENLQLIDKKIKIYKNFVIINNEIKELLEKNFNIYISDQEYFYLSHKDGDIIVINNFKQKTIFLGNYDFINNIYSFDYILDFYKKENLESELKNIETKNLKDYLNDITVFNSGDYIDYTSPIFIKNDIIGTCYKYTSSTTDYSPCFNFANYLNSDSILNSIFLYFNYTKLENQLLNLKEINNLDYYLINHQLIKQIKLNSNYEEIIKILKQNHEINIFEDENNYKKKLLSVIKSLSLDLLQNNTIEIETINDDDYEQLLTLDILPITYYDNNNLETVIIYNNFELLSKKTIDSIIKKELRINLESYKCNFIDGKIVINYPNKNENNQYISLIGKLSEENVFLTEYILIYESNKDREIHLYNILPRLNTFLNNCHFINNTEIITFDGINKNGRIIKYENNNIKI